MSTIPGNPYALLVNNVVSEVIYMQDRSAEEIEQYLKSFTYDEFINCSEYGEDLSIGQERIGSFFVFEKPYPSWELDMETGYWNPPIPAPTNTEFQYAWNESTLSWDVCVPCTEENSSSNSLTLKDS